MEPFIVLGERAEAARPENHAREQEAKNAAHPDSAEQRHDNAGRDQENQEIAGPALNFHRAPIRRA